MSLQNDSLITEFDRYRFAREPGGALAELPAARRDERSFLVLDCLRYRLARLHLFEGAANQRESVNQFTRQMNAIAALNQPLMTPLLTHGRDDSELFYVTEFVDGEALGDYLRRTGGLTESAALQVTLDLVELLLVTAPRPAALEQFDLGHLVVSPDVASPQGWRLHFGEFSGWNEPSLASPEALVQRLALQLYNLLGGFVFRSAPSRLFAHEAQQTSEELREVISSVLREEDGGQSLAAFASTLRPLLADALDRDRSAGVTLPPPRRFLEQWFTEGRGLSSIDPGPDYRHLTETDDGETLSFDAATDRSSIHGRVRFHLFPNWESIPREGWLEQHHSSLRRGGRGLPNQVGVVELEPAGRGLLIGEEPVLGVSLRRLVSHHGPLDLAHAVALGRKVSSAIDVMEKTAGAAPVWWLPPRNVYLVTGDPDPASLEPGLASRGAAAWQRLPVRLRLHQTAGDLVEGLAYPDSIMARINRGGKQGEIGRRTTVLLPLLWHLLTGETLDWDSPLACPEGVTLSSEVLAALEKARQQAGEDPRNVHTSVVSQLEKLVGADATSAPDTATVGESDFGDGMVSEPVTLFDTGPIRPPAKKPDDSSASTTVTFDNDGGNAAGETYLARRRRRRSLLPRPPVSAGEVENLGTIEDPLYAQAVARQPESTGRTEGENPRLTQAGGSLSLAPFSAGQRMTAPAPEPAEPTNEEPPPETAPAETNRRPGFFRFSKSKKRTDTKSKPAIESATRETKAAEEVRDEKESTVAGPTPGDDWTRSFRESCDSREDFEEEVESHAETEDREESAGSGGESISFFTFLSSQSVPAEQSEASKLAPAPASIAAAAEKASASDSSREIEDEPTPESRREFRPLTERVGSWLRNRRSVSHETSPGITEAETELPTAEEVASAAPDTVSADTGTRPPSALKKAPQIAGAAALIWGVTYLLVSFSGNAERRTLAETFSPVVRTDYLKMAAPLPAREEGTGPGDAAPAIDERVAAEDPVATAALADQFLPIDRALGLKWLRRSAEFGNARHQRQLGLILAEVPEQLPEAVSWLGRAAAQDDVEASFYYGVALLRGRGVPPDPEAALPLLEKAAAAGDGRAFDLLGICLAEGTGCAADPRAAFGCFQQAVEAGNVQACYNLAVRYAKGLGTPRSEERAAGFFRQGAERGDPDCMHAYGKCLESGFGVAADFDAAVSWMRKAATLGQPDALAWCLRQGLPMGVASAK